MDYITIQQKLTQKFQENIIGFNENHGILSVQINPDYNIKVIQYLKEDNELAFNFLTDLTAVHYPDRIGQELTVTYLLYNMRKKIHLRINLSINIQKPDVFTLTKLFETANWLERECYDFFGVNFIGHPNLIRIMNVDEMDYHPLRKEYPLEDQRRTDKDDEMFGRGNYFSPQNQQ